MVPEPTRHAGHSFLPSPPSTAQSSQAVVPVHNKCINNQPSTESIKRAFPPITTSKRRAFVRRTTSGDDSNGSSLEIPWAFIHSFIFPQNPSTYYARTTFRIGICNNSTSNPPVSFLPRPSSRNLHLINSLFTPPPRPDHIPSPHLHARENHAPATALSRCPPNYQWRGALGVKRSANQSVGTYYPARSPAPAICVSFQIVSLIRRPTY